MSKPQEARDKLLAALVVVRQKFEAGADDWQHSLLRTFREYCLCIGMEKKLLNPLQQMLNETDQRIFDARRKASGKTGKPPSPIPESIPMIFAAAAVSVLKVRHRHATIDEAVGETAKLTGIDKKKLKVFRDNINRGLKAESLSSAYEDTKQEISNWSLPEILGALASLRDFVK